MICHDSTMMFNDIALIFHSHDSFAIAMMFNVFAMIITLFHDVSCHLHNISYLSYPIACHLHVLCHCHDVSCNG